MAQPYDELKGNLATEPQLSMDETPIKHANQKAWLWTFVDMQGLEPTNDTAEGASDWQFLVSRDMDPCPHREAESSIRHACGIADFRAEAVAIKSDAPYIGKWA